MRIGIPSAQETRRIAKRLTAKVRLVREGKVKKSKKIGKVGK